MNAVTLTALAAVVLGATMVGMSLGSALQAHRLNKVEARLVVLEQDSHTHNILGSKPRFAQGGVVHPTDFKIDFPLAGVELFSPVPAASHVSAKQPWNGAGYHS